MRQRHTLGVLSGFHEAPLASTNLKSSWNFTNAGVQAGDAVTNQSTGATGTVSSVVDDNTLATDVTFNPGDFFEVTLSTEYEVSSNLGPVYEFVCKLCGKATKREEIEAHNGRCKECYDPPHPSELG